MTTVLFIFLIGIFVFLVASAISIYQYNRYGIAGDKTKRIIYIFLGVSGIELLISLIFIVKTNW